MSHDYSYRARCVKVVDGDTVDCDVDLGFHITTRVRVRLAGINAPELNSPNAEHRTLANEAKNHLIDSILNKDILLETSKTEKYGRYLGSITCGGININSEMILMGLATTYV